MYKVFRAPAIDRANNRSAAVLPSVGVEYRSPAAATPFSAVTRSRGQ